MLSSSDGNIKGLMDTINSRCRPFPRVYRGYPEDDGQPHLVVLGGLRVAATMSADPAAPKPRPVRPRPSAILIPKTKPAPVVVEGWAPPTDNTCAPSLRSFADGPLPPCDDVSYSAAGMVGMSEGITTVDPEARDNPPPPPPPDDPPASSKRRSSWVQKFSKAGSTPSASTPFSSMRKRPSGGKRDETSNLREAVDAFRARERALLAQIETQKAAFDAREAALRFQLAEAARREVELRGDLESLSRREESLTKRVRDLEKRAVPGTPGTAPTDDGDLSPLSRSTKYRSKWRADAGEQLASARSADASRPRNLRDLESSFKPKHSATPPRSPASLTASPKPLRAITPPPGAPRDRGEPRVEKAVSELIEKDKAREGDVQRMLEMVANLQSEMASLKRENGRRDAGPRPPPDEPGSRIPELS